jgi:beta-lactamase class C
MSGLTCTSMMKLLLALTCSIASHSDAAGSAEQSKIKVAVDATVQPLKEKYDIPGMAIAITVSGKNYFYNYGVKSKETREPITIKLFLRSAH